MSKDENSNGFERFTLSKLLLQSYRYSHTMSFDSPEQTVDSSVLILECYYFGVHRP
jgi:hypothetical protein